MLLHDGRPVYLSPMAELEPGTVFAGHRIEAVAGRGGMGVVYQATQLALDRTIALKVIAPGLLEDQAVRNRFVRESKVAASIDHPNVIPIYYAGEEHGIAYIAMRYVPGDDVRSRVRREGPLAPERAAHIATQIGAALDAAHSAGLVHRDVKPANVLLTAEDHVYLTDFGLTKHAVSVAGTTKPGHWVGTLDYVAPEQIRGERVDARADVYALGCVLFYMLTGQVPFSREGDEARLWAHLSEPPPKPTDLVDGLPQLFDDVISRALAKDPEERYPSAGDLGRAARAAAAGRPPADHERLVATGAAAPVESETVTAGVKPLVTLKSQDQSEAETQLQERSRRGRARRFPVGWLAALAGAVAIGVAAAVALGIGQDDNPAPPGTATAPGESAPRLAGEITIGQRPNVVRVFGDNVFVGSFRQDRMRIVDAASGEIRSYAPKIGAGVSEGAIGFDSLWLTMIGANTLVRLDARTGRRRGKPIRLPGSPTSVAVSKDAVWVVYGPEGATLDTLAKIDPETGATLATAEYPAGITALTTSPTALWVADKSRARVHRADLETGEIDDTIRVGRTRSEDLAYGADALWAATPDDNIVHKIETETEEVIPISVGSRPRQIALADGRVYATNYSSSDLSTIDAKTAHLIGDSLRLSASPYSLDVDARRNTLWVASLADNKLSRVLTGPGG